MKKAISPGQIVILNGVPRSGKSSIAKVMQDSFDGIWMNLGVDHMMKMTPARVQPGIGLRPGGERPDLEPFIVQLYEALYASIAVYSRLGINVVVDVGHHDAYSIPRHILPKCAAIVTGLPVLFVGVYCPIDVIMERRIRTWQMGYNDDGSIPEPVIRWQHAVHSPGLYDLSVDTSTMSAEQCAIRIKTTLEDGSCPHSFEQLSRKNERSNEVSRE